MERHPGVSRLSTRLRLAAPTVVASSCILSRIVGAAAVFQSSLSPEWRSYAASDIMFEDAMTEFHALGEKA
jgi:hypothetical protein